MFSVEEFCYQDGNFSHFSVCANDENGEILDVVSGIVHNDAESAQTELRALRGE